MKAEVILVAFLSSISSIAASQSESPARVAVVFVVDDPGDAPADTVPVFFPRTLRSAIQCANFTTALDEIRFAVPMIQPASRLPDIARPVILDGLVGTSRLILDFSFIPSPFYGLGVFGGSSIVMNVEIRNAPGSGIIVLQNNNIIRRCFVHHNNGPGINLNPGNNNSIVDNRVYGNTGGGGSGIQVGSNNNRIDSNFIGTEDGFTASPNSLYGIHVWTRNNIIRNNVISGNAWDGIYLTIIGGDTSKFNLIENNRIGTNVDRMQALPNRSGIATLGNRADTIRGNLISGNALNGIGISGNTSNLLVEGNLIGTSVTGLAAIGNRAGVNSSGQNIHILNNTISGNTDIGIQVNAGMIVVEGNRIGTDSFGSFPIANQNGIRLFGSNYIVGGSSPASRNIISGNTLIGININGATTTGNLVEGNYIGTDWSGVLSISNGTGIWMNQGCFANVVQSNVVSGNNDDGILVSPRGGLAPHDNIIRRNRIGISPDGMTAVPNFFNGIRISNSAGTVVGGTMANDGNIISGNLGNGISIDTSSGSVVAGNRIGLNEAGTMAIPNHGHGIAMIDADSNVIGNLNVESGNYIAGNDSAGIAILGSLAQQNRLLVNFLGTSVAGNQTGVLIRDGSHNTIGGISSGYLNFIMNNLENGVTIVGDSNRVEMNVISQNGSSSSPPGTGHGIVVRGNGNIIGRAPDSTIGSGPDINIIKENRGSGIRIDSGSGNAIWSNSIYSNDSLGIDLSPSGVTKNDTLDSDSGPNGLQNFPLVDSLQVIGTTTRVFGRLESKPSESFKIDFYTNEQCDQSLYGEGKTWHQLALTTTGANGTGSFVVDLPVVLDTNRVLTMTATDLNGNTSEFSRCWPKFLRILDARDSIMRNKEFVLYRVRNNPPILTETLVDTFMTNDKGLILLGNEDAEENDSIKVYRLLDVFPSAKRNSTLPVTAYSVHLDNAEFDSVTYAMNYDEIDSSIVQNIRLTHTTIAYNLFVSVEWDAEVQYLDSLRRSFQGMSNYLYDVGDGQMRLDTVHIADERNGRSSADIRIFASNVQWPLTNTHGIVHDGAWFLSMPRRFFGDSTSNRNLSERENPPNPAAVTHYRTTAHEFGHYFGLYDEYMSSGRCADHLNYGFMERHYVIGGDAASEMSWSRQYANMACQNTNQWNHHHRSCWDTFDSFYQRIYDGVLANMIRPDERTLISGRDYFLGPNEYQLPLNYDVGSRIVFLGSTAPPNAFTQFTRVATTQGIPFGKARVFQTLAASGQVVDQGMTADMSGGLYILGHHPSDVLHTSSRGIIQIAPLQIGAPYTWYSGTATGSSTDTLEIPLNPVRGEFPLVCGAALNSTDIQMTLFRLNAFAALPTIEARTEDGNTFSYPLISTDSVYSASVTDSLGTGGIFEVKAIDDSSDEFFFNIRYSISAFDSASREAGANNGDVDVFLDGAMTGIERVMFASTDYPVIEAGLPQGILQVSDAHAISVSPSVPFVGTNDIRIRYDNLTPENPALPRIFQWNSTLRQWIDIGGTVNALQSTVNATISEPGVYAAFAYEPTLDVGPHGSGVPEEYELFQNYPNPFNPETKIEYQIPTISHVTIKVFDLLGREVVTLVNDEKPAGKYSVTWDASGLASGVYFYRFKSGGFSETKRLILLK